MTNAHSYLETVGKVQQDIAVVGDFSSGLGLTLDAADKSFEVPATLEDMLRNPARAIQLPDPLVAVLGFVPFGIGTAIKTIDRIADTTAEVIERQADIMGALDDTLTVPSSVVSVVSAGNTLLGTALSASAYQNGQLQEEAELLAESLGGQRISVTFDLRDRMESYTATADQWFETRDTLLTPFRAASAAFDDALDTLETLLPDTGLLEDASAALLAVMAPISDAAKSFENAICIDFVLTPEITIPGTPAITITPAIPPVYGTNPFTGETFVLIPGIPAVVIPAIPTVTIPAVNVDICEILMTAQSGFDAVIQTVFNAALSLVGADFEQIANGLLDDLLRPLQPIFDIIDALKAAAADLFAELTDAFAPMVNGLGDMISAIEDATISASLFDNTVTGDTTASPADMADVLSGTIGEDAIFGLSGDDRITGGGNDFIFGGKGHDRLESNGDEAYGGRGNDQLTGSNPADRMDGGVGRDILLGAGGDDLLHGGGGRDTVRAGRGDDTVSGDGGADRLFGNGGRDALNGGSGADILDGGLGKDVLQGGKSADTISGGKGADQLKGGRGTDVLDGGHGDDVLTGGMGADLFVFAENGSDDTITDFAAKTNREKIDLRALTEIESRADRFANHVTRSGKDVVIDDGDGTTITLLDVSMADLSGADFLV